MRSRVTAPSSGTDRSGGLLHGPDDYAAVPEPGTGLLVALGTAGLLASRRRLARA
ncbi:MAG: PEP-CTERM sorting domain-containing protein [Myxococcota bacterium]|nr:PEP-CTERM sorting domain-containing protein [Myxococcota bacterium]